MDLLPTDEQEEIVASVRSVIADRHVIGEPCTDELWSSAASQGWFALGVSEADGGVGYSVTEEMLVFAELGRACVPGPFLATVLAARAALATGDESLAAALMSGDARAAWAERLDAERFVRLDGPGSVVTLVVDADSVRLVDDARIAVQEEWPGLDTLVPTDVIAEPEPVDALPATVADDLRLRGTVLVASMLAGMAQATTEQSVAYGHDREQFGQPIGGFQAVKHRCADMATRAEVASCQVSFAALTLANGSSDAAFHAYGARVVAATAAVENAQVNVQNHGGIGFTWEHSAHRYVTRSRVYSNVLGTRSDHLRDLLAAPAPG
jgi:alkylation response protein AidB-like acyl-CoA dehydrogenase